MRSKAAKLATSCARLVQPAGFLTFLQLSQASSQADAGKECKQVLHRQLLCGCCCCSTARVPLCQSAHASERTCWSMSGCSMGVCILSVVAAWHGVRLCCNHAPLSGLLLPAITTSASERTCQWGCGCGTAACRAAAAAAPAQVTPPGHGAAARRGGLGACPPGAARGGRA